jgi:3-hydroxy acid dehydrogenase/malonic semialdehyde reductase
MKTVLITGATSGFGEAAARKYVAEGYQAVICGRRMERLTELASELSSESDSQKGAAVLPLQLDVRDRSAVETAITSLPASFRKVDVLINNAGLALGLGGADEADLDHWDTMVDTNIKGLMYLCRAVLPLMTAHGAGHVVNIGSVAASWPYPGGNTYGGTKAFVQQFSRNLRSDLLGKNIRVTNIEPGMCETEFSVVRFDGDETKASQVYAGMQPLKAEDIAEIIYWTTALPPHININQLEVMPVAQAWSGFAVHRDGS